MLNIIDVIGTVMLWIGGVIPGVMAFIAIERSTRR